MGTAPRAARGRVIGGITVRHPLLPAVCLLIGVAVAAPVGAQSPLGPPPFGPGPGMPAMMPPPGANPAPVPPQGLYPAQQAWPQMTGPAPMPQMPPAPAPAPQMQPAPMQRAPMPIPPQTPAGMPAAAPMPMTLMTQTGTGVSVEKRGPEVCTLAQPLAYEIIVRNTGSAPVSQVRVEDELPAGARLITADPQPEVMADRLTWNLNMLEAGGERRLQVKLQLAADGEFRSTATVHFAATASMHTRVVQPRLVVSMHGPEQVSAGDAVPFHITMANPGTGPVTNLLLHCKLADGLTHPQGQVVEAEIGTLAAGETRNITLTTQAAKTGQFAADLSATADGGMEASAHSAITILGPALQLLRTGPPKCYLKSEVGFDLEVVNSGPVAAGYVEVGDTLPAGLDFVAATEGGRFDATNRTILWRLPALPAGGHQTVSYRVKAISVGEMPDRAAARSDRGSDVRADATFTVEGVPALSLEVVDLEDPIQVGGDLTYEIRVVNQGSCPCSNIQIVAQAPEGLMPREGTGPSAFRANGLEVMFEPLAKLAVKADAVYRVKVRGVQPGDYRFRVQMTCDQLRQPVMKEESSRVYKEGP
jgi:uncharacterized repeat protein (TIGR01451 family)